jgi:hypothetical protein
MAVPRTDKVGTTLKTSKYVIEDGAVVPGYIS